MTQDHYKSPHLLTGTYQLVKRRVMKKREAVGILKPSGIVGVTKDGEAAVLGTGGTHIVHDTNPDSFWEGLVRSDAILFGSEQEVDEVCKLLENPITSRNYAYLTLLAKDCCELLNFYSIISEATISFIGCGGIGSISAITIAGLGVKTIKLIDSDVIEESNLNRQLFFTKADIGRAKVEVPIALIYDAVNTANDLGVKFISAGYIVDKLKVSPETYSKPIYPLILQPHQRGYAPTH